VTGSNNRFATGALLVCLALLAPYGVALGAALSNAGSDCRMQCRTKRACCSRRSGVAAFVAESCPGGCCAPLVLPGVSPATGVRRAVVAGVGFPAPQPLAEPFPAVREDCSPVHFARFQRPPPTA
jgi:hypothetical protein